MQQEKEPKIELVQKDGNLVQKDGNLIQKDGNRNGDRWNKKKKRGPNRQTVTLGGLKKIVKAKKRKEKQKLRRKLGEMVVQGGWKKGKPKGPLPPTRSVMFMDNTA